jgi:hypothetical protein
VGLHAPIEHNRSMRSDKVDIETSTNEPIHDTGGVAN